MLIKNARRQNGGRQAVNTKKRKWIIVTEERKQQIVDNIARIKGELSVNPFGERVLLVAATKTRSVEEICAAIEGGVDAIAENRAQEFRDKNDFLPPFPRHFIGSLQSNKLKYVVGKTQLIHSCDTLKLAEEISALSTRLGVVTNVLIEVNVGGETTKSGFPFSEAEAAYRFISGLPGVVPRGFMAMLPRGVNEETGGEAVRKMRALLDEIKRSDKSFDLLSMGMSGDYALCVKNGANVVRIGTGIFGERA